MPERGKAKSTIPPAAGQGLPVEAILEAWMRRSAEPPASEVVRDAERMLRELDGPLPPQDLIRLAHTWVSTCQVAGLTLFQSLSLFADLQGIVQSRVALECSLLVAQVWADRTEERMQEQLTAKTEALQKANRALRETDKSRADFISAYSHELRTPLTAITGACELLLEDFADELTGPQFEYISMINQSAVLIRQLINDVLDFEKLEARRLELHIEPLCVEEMVHDVSLLVAPLLHDKSLRWVQDVSPGLPCVAADAVRVRQILLNLVSNAIKFTPERGTVRIEAVLEKAAGKRGASVALSVSDTGIGIAPEHQKLIFERFRQVQDRHSQGTGLGLPIAKRLVELHGGRLTLKSVPGEGTTFTFTIPVAAEER